MASRPDRAGQTEQVDLADLADLAFKVRLLQDRAEIADLVARYGIAVDDRDGRAVAALFTSDGVFDGHALGSSAGAEAVAAYFEERWREYGVTFHYTHEASFDIGGGNTATGVVPGHAEVAYRGRAMWTAFRYDDVYARVEGRWRFRSRKVRFFYAMPLDKLPTMLAVADRKRWPGTEPIAADLPTGRLP